MVNEGATLGAPLHLTGREWKEFCTGHSGNGSSARSGLSEVSDRRPVLHVSQLKESLKILSN